MSGRAPLPYEEISSWIDILEEYIQRTSLSCLDLNDIPVETVKSILEYLSQSQIIELILDGTILSKEMESFQECIKTGKIEKLRINSLLYCELSALVEVLNNTKIVELHTSIRDEIWHDVMVERKLASYLRESGLVKLSLNLWSFTLSEGLPSSCLTSLRINSCQWSNALASIFPALPYCQITDLALVSAGLDDSFIKELSQHLAASQIENLSLARNKITDDGLNVLAQGLIDSNVSELDLSVNQIRGSNNFGHHLQESKIRVLDLSHNHITSGQMFQANSLKASSLEELVLSYCKIDDVVGAELIKSLRWTKLKKIDLQSNYLGCRSITVFPAILEATSLEEVDLSTNPLPSERFDLLSKFVKASQLKSIILDGPNKKGETTSCLRFLEGIKNSSVLTIKIQNGQFFKNDAESLTRALRSSTHTHFNLELSKLIDIFPILVGNLKYTSLTYLNLAYCSIEDEDVLFLTDHLNETKILNLDLSSNKITDVGVRALANCWRKTSLIQLALQSNDISKDCLKFLMEQLTGSLITALNLKSQKMDYEYEVLLIEKVLLENKVESHKHIAFFKRVYLMGSNGNFCFHLCHYFFTFKASNVKEFLEDCLEFYKTVLEQPAVVSILLEEPSLSCSREEIVSLLFYEFPQQLVEFVRIRVEANAWEYVKFLKRAEELGLVKIVKNLLLSRPLFIIDEKKHILHPYFYKLLVKYKQPICITAFEPHRIEKIREYFMMHSDLEGAEVVVNFLSSDEQKLQMKEKKQRLEAIKQIIDKYGPASHELVKQILLRLNSLDKGACFLHVSTKNS